MNTEQTEAKLKISRRSLQRLIKRLNIKLTYTRGKSGKREANYTPEIIKQLKDELSKPTEREEPPESNEPAPLALRDDARQAQVDALAQLAVRHDEMLLRLIRLQEQPRQLPPTPGEKPAPAINLSDKLLLSIPEASRLSGIPADKLRSAVNSGKLKAVKSVGRGLGKVKRSDLDLYVKKL